MNVPIAIRKLASCVAALVFLAGVQAQNASRNYSLTVTAERPDALYKRGEKVTFKVKLLLDKAPVKEGELDWSITRDGVTPNASGKLKLENGEGAVSASLDAPGFLLCRATFVTPAEKKIVGLGGAGVDPLEIKPSLPPPDDFDAFWAEQKKELAKIPMKFQLTPIESPVSDVEVFDVQIDCQGPSVSGYFAKPKGAAARSVPVLLSVQGAGVRSSTLRAAADWAKRGFLAMDINAHGIPNGKPLEFYTEMGKVELLAYPTRGRESRETMYFRHMFLRVVRALDFLTLQPEWNGGPVVVTGSSQGGAQSIVAAGLDSRVTFVAPGVPAMCDHSGGVADRVSGWPKMVPNGPDGKPDAKILEAARYYDCMNFATRSKAAALFTVGFIDTTCPPSTVYAAYNAYAGKKEIFNDPPSPHAVTPQAGEAIRKAVLEHVAQFSAK